MFHCQICGEKSRMFSTEDDLLGHMFAQHRNWLKTKTNKREFIGETEDDILTELNSWLAKGDWQSQVSEKRPWYTEPHYNGPKTLLESTLSGKSNTGKEIQFGKAHKIRLEEELQKKEAEIDKLRLILKEKSRLTDEALELATESALENAELKNNDLDKQKINWTKEVDNSQKFKRVHYTEPSIKNYAYDQPNSEEILTDDEDPLEHVFNGLQLQIDKACEHARSLRLVSEWRQKRIHKKILNKF